jgi:hypothetical protein
MNDLHTDLIGTEVDVFDRTRASNNDPWIERLLYRARIRAVAVTQDGFTLLAQVTVNHCPEPFGIQVGALHVIPMRWIGGVYLKPVSTLPDNPLPLPPRVVNAVDDT